MKRLRRITDSEIIAEFLHNEFYERDFDHDRERFTAVVEDPDLGNELENAVRRALLFRRRGPMWRELPPDTQWWEVELEPADVARLRVFPRAHWRRIAKDSFFLPDIVTRLAAGNVGRREQAFLAKLRAIAASLPSATRRSTVLLIAIDDEHPVTIYEGNHRLTAALLNDPALLARLRVACAFSPRMAENVWYSTKLRTFGRYLFNRLRHLVDKEADVERVLSAMPPAPQAVPDGGTTALAEKATEVK
jgi:hypothetical protein